MSSTEETAPAAATQFMLPPANLRMNYTGSWGRQNSPYGAMGKEMCCFSILPKMTLRHCYPVAPVLNWGLSQLMTLVALLHQIPTVTVPGVSITTGITDLLDECKDVFEGLGDLPGEYHIVTDDAVPPVEHPPRRVPVALRNQIKEKLDEMVASDVSTPVTEPTEWVSSMLVIVKPKKLRICLDPRHLNKAIRREHYQLPTVEEVATRLSQAKKFTVVDAKDGFWQKRLDTESSYRTTLNTPFGRYRWNRIPFGICSAPEVWQRTMHESVEDLEGVEVIADDFLIAGFGTSDEVNTSLVNTSLERHERALFEKCRLWNLKLNRAKVRRHQSSVKFMGHLLTPQGLRPDP